MPGKVNRNIVVAGFSPEITGCNIEAGWFVFLSKISQPRSLKDHQKTFDTLPLWELTCLPVL